MDITTAEHSASRLGCRELARRNDEADRQINCIKATIHSDPSKHSARDYTGMLLKKLTFCKAIAGTGIQADPAATFSTGFASA
ncbi:hypothetical protein [Dokdonella sp.]|uniref:hypothetical protein n=1 Tax=Dokdonella sp. TaxID=2291710 RepID=UPI0025B9D0DA|nr:hypothetical protein [Dokdonella sp.]MBX3688952.1 hypothetical protein [Dokdonella sp.]